MGTNFTPNPQSDPDASASAAWAPCPTGDLGAAFRFLLLLLPALLSVHLVTRREEVAWVRLDPAARVAAAPGALVPAAVLSLSPAAIRVRHEATAPIPPPGRTFQGRRWMLYRALVSAWRRREILSVDAAAGAWL